MVLDIVFENSQTLLYFIFPKRANREAELNESGLHSALSIHGRVKYKIPIRAWDARLNIYMHFWFFDMFSGSIHLL